MDGHDLLVQPYVDETDGKHQFVQSVHSVEGGVHLGGLLGVSQQEILVVRLKTVVLSEQQTPLVTDDPGGEGDLVGTAQVQLGDDPAEDLGNAQEESGVQEGLADAGESVVGALEGLDQVVKVRLTQVGLVVSHLV